MTNSLTTQATNGIIQLHEAKERDMDIRDVANEISNITGAIEDAMNEAENIEAKVQERVDDLERVKNDLEAGREKLDIVMSALQEFDGEQLASALDDAESLGID
jgi:DNA repair ATPase RecN